MTLATEGVKAASTHGFVGRSRAQPAVNETATRPVSAIKPYERNARIHTPAQVEQIAASIRRLGMCARIIELDPKFADVIVRRWQNYTGRRATMEDGTQFPA